MTATSTITRPQGAPLVLHPSLLAQFDAHPGFPECCLRDTCAECLAQLEGWDGSEAALCGACRVQAEFEDGDPDAADGRGDR